MTRILAVRLSALGDVIHTIPAVVALRDALGAEISWAVERPYVELVETVAGVNAIPATMRKWGRSLVASRREIAAFVGATRGHDLAVDFQGLIKSALVARVSRARQRYGFDRSAIREKAASLFINRPVAVDQRRHVVEWNLQLASAVAGRELTMPRVDFARYAAPARHANEIVILPGAGKPNKQWSAERYGEVAARLGGSAIAVWGPHEHALAERTGLPVAPPTDLRELAAILRDAKLVIGGDTGPLHLAAALGTPVVGLYGPTSADRNGPYGQVQNCVRAPSMDAISAGDVVRKAQEVLGR